ncbi:dihydroorotase [Gluconacetobacter sacchari]|uniref:dihydroorotase n=1 Tax=Gluconacetobacter sacchari TaxID=92759 RepID=UPI0039B5C51C
MLDLVIKGAIVVPAGVLGQGWVAIADGKIAQVGQGTAPSARATDDRGDDLILPGGIDAQIHSRSQAGQEDFIWSTRAAAAGGVTTIMDMPYDDGFLVSDGDKLRQKAREAAPQVQVDFGLWGTVNPLERARAIPGMAAAGAVGFKFSTFETHPTRFPRIDAPLMAECFQAVARCGLVAGVHNEHDEFVRWAIARTQALGVEDWSAHGMSRPPLSEALAVAEVYEIAAATRCSAHIVHSSIARGYELCASYRQQGVDTTIEACIHYLTLDEEHDVARLGGKAKINPPVRPRAEVEALWAHLAAGNVTIVSTDHVSWGESRKTMPRMLDNASGVPGLEVLYPLLLTGLEARGLSMSWAARLLGANPARLFRIADRKGTLAPGLDADITIARRETWSYAAEESENAFAKWSPYDGRTLGWRIAGTYLRGQMVYDGRSVLARPGDGRWVKPWTGRS